jgi:hypothetical protein
MFCRASRVWTIRLAEVFLLSYCFDMTVHEIAAAIMELSEADRLELARRIVDSVAADQQNAAEIARAVEGIEDILTGKVVGLTEDEFQRTCG